MKRERVFRPLTLKVSSIPEAASRQRIETLFDAFTADRATANESARRAAIADAESGMAMQRARMGFVTLLLEAGTALEAIRGEPTWVAYRRDGDIVFECPFTEVDMRNAMRVQRATIEQSARGAGVGESLYEGDEDDDKEPTIGFGATGRH